MKNIKIVIGCNFGDCGKGLMTDYFSTNTNTVVVCHNGGAQKGHTVVTPDGKRHVFNHFGSGTLAGADTYLSEDYIVNPMMFRKEYEELVNMGYLIGCVPKVFINEKCLVTTPYDMILNQIAEESRNTDKHGSCGTGIFETIHRNNKLESFKLNAKKTFSDNLWINTYIDSLLRRIRLIYIGKRFSELNLTNVSEIWWNRINNDNIINNFIDDIEFMKEHSIIISNEKALLDGHDNIVFEGAQGLLLDQNNTDYFPNLTPSNTGLTNPVKILKENRLTNEDVEVCYVTRSYVTRHGAGRFETECESKLIGEDLFDSTNIQNPFQDTLRYGKLDKQLLLKTITKDMKNLDFRAKISLAITHLDETKGVLVCKDYNRYPNDGALNIFSTIYTSWGASRVKIMKVIRGIN